MASQTSNNPFSDYSSKIKSVLIELPGFGYYHGPSSVKKKNKKIIGRDSIIRRLKNIIINSDSPTGSYLVTGYRGTGKSSLVNNAISEISLPENFLIGSKKYLFLLFITLFLSFMWSYIGSRSFNIASPSVLWTAISMIIVLSVIINRIGEDYTLGGAWSRLVKLAKLMYKENTYFMFGRLYRPLSIIRKVIIIFVFFVSIVITSVSNLMYLIISPLRLKKSTKYAHQHTNLLRNIYFLFFVQLSGLLIYYILYCITPISHYQLLFSFFASFCFVVLLARISPYFFKFQRKVYYALGNFINKANKRRKWIIQNKRIRSDKDAKDGPTPKYKRKLIYSYLKSWWVRNKPNIDDCRKSKLLLKPFFYLVNRFKVWLNNIYNASRIIPLHINLSYSNFNERDVLQLLVFNFRKKFKQRHSRAFGWNYPRIILLIVFVILIQKFTVTQNALNEIAGIFPVSELLPSQTQAYRHQQDILVEKYSEFMKNNKYNYTALYSKLFKSETVVTNSQNTNTLSQITNNIKASVFFLDLFVTSRWVNVKEHFNAFYDDVIFSNETIHRVHNKISVPNIIRLNLNYITILGFLFLFVFLKKTNRRLGFSTNAKIEKELDALYDSIVSSQETSLENTAGFSKIGVLFSMKNKQRKRYPIANARDIEKGLINILQMMEDVPGYMFRPEFIIVFDELDKLGENVDMGNQTTDIGNLRFDGIKERERHEVVRVFLKNMKYFLTTAPVKFIIIAGREMYDAYLADVSDRDLSLRNVFNEVIYIESFLSQPFDLFQKQNKDITYLTEQYVCQFLIPEDYLKNEEPNLNLFKNFMLLNYADFLTVRDKKPKSDFDRQIKEKYEHIDILQKQKEEKVMILLHQFIVYLLHMSNGIPTKIVSLFEKYISKGEKQYFEKSGDQYLWAGKNQENFYLCFTPEDQYEIGLTASLMSPVFYSISHHLKNYSDKLLFSTTFLINHIFKYHPFAFSLYNLESSPEMHSLHKSPDLRNYLKKTINYLCQNHIDDVLEGFHQYKYSKRLALELSYISRISEQSSAAFNFSMEESGLIRTIYSRKIKNLPEQASNNSENYFLKAHYYMLLGDISYFEMDMDEALRCYSVAIKFINQTNITKTEKEIILFTKLLLRSGLCCEKVRNFEDALNLYSEALGVIIAYRDISLEKLNISLGKNEGEQFFVKGYNYPNSGEELFFEYKSLCYSPNIKINQLQPKLLSYLTPGKIDILKKIAFFENSRLFYQPLIARLHIIEKNGPDGVTQKDIEQAEKEFEFLIRPINKNEKHTIEAAFYKKLANLLFYKNYQGANLLPDKKCNPAFYFYQKSLKVHLSYFLLSNSGDLPETNNLTKLELLNPESKDDLVDFLLYSIYAFSHKKQKNFRSNIFQNIAEVLSALGDCIFASAKDGPNELNDDSLKDLFNYLTKEESKDFKLVSESIRKHAKSPVLCVLYYQVAALYFLRAKKYKQCAYQTQKIFYTIHDLWVYNNSEIEVNIDIADNSYLENIYQHATRASFIAYENVHNIQIEKHKEIFLEKVYINDDLRDRISLKKLTLDMDTEPLTFMFEKLKIMNAKRREKYEALRKSFSCNLVSPYLMENSMFNRAIRLRFKEYLNKELLEELFDIPNFFDLAKNPYAGYSKYIDILFAVINSEKSDLQDKFNAKVISFIKTNTANIGRKACPADLFEYLVSDSIYCLAEIIDIYNTFGQDNIFNHSYIASVHEEMQNWLFIYRHYVFLLELTEIFKDINSFVLLREREPYKQFVDPLVILGNVLNPEIDPDIIGGLLEEKIERQLNRLNDLKIDKQQDYKKRIKSLKSAIKRSLKKDSLNCLDPLYHGEQAIMHYFTAIDMHKEGKVYKQLIDKLFYLNDDYNDGLFHYRLAQERYRINTEWVKDHKDKINKLKNYTAVYKQENYIITRLH